MPRRRIWCETLPWPELRAPAVLALVARYDLDLLVAVRPPDLPALPELLAAFADAGVRPGLWPMVSDADGRWASARNAPVFTAFAREVLRAADRGPRASASALVLDLEPSFHAVAAAFSYTPGPRARAMPPRTGYAAAREAFRVLASEARGRGLSVVSAVVPMTLLDPIPPAPAPWQRAMGTPVDGIPWDHASVMLYTSMVEGWSRGAFRRSDAVGLLAAGCRAAANRFGPAAGVSLGAVGTGALGDEPVYRSPAELAEDVSVARACGIDDLSLFDLGGVLARPPAEAWLDAFTRTPAAERPPGSTARATACLRAAAVPGALARLAARLAPHLRAG